MTFSVLGTDRSGAIGMAVCSSSPAVAARCIHLRAGVGGAASQNVTDPRLGTAILDVVEHGLAVRTALDQVLRDHDSREYRQLAVLDLDGVGATYSGVKTLGVHHERVGRYVVAAGNMLADRVVVDALVEAFEVASGELEERLLTALEAGLAAGGEAGPVHSAGMAVVRTVRWRETDLRVDWSDTPVSDLRRLLDVWLPLRDDYVSRALTPADAPSYGVSGDE